MTKSYLLVTNDIVIGSSDGLVKDGKVHLTFPALLIHQRANHGPLGFLLSPWLPSELLKTYTVEVDFSKIICEMTLSPAMERFYNNWALAEKDKQATFVEVFEKQITDIEKTYLERTRFTREQQQRTPMAANTALTDALIELFDDKEHSWGDPTTTN